MKRISIYAFVVLVLGLVWTSCGGGESSSDNADDNVSSEQLTEQLAGRWILEKTVRGGKDADYTGAYFTFDPTTSVFTSDLIDETQSRVYADGVVATLSEQTLTFEELPNTFEVLAITDSSVVMLTNMMSFDFEFTFKRTE